MLQITPQMRVLVAIESVDGRKGIDGLAQLCRQKLDENPFSGAMFLFRNRSHTAIKILCYDGQGYWLCQKRLSQGRFKWWPSSAESGAELEVHQVQMLLSAGDPNTRCAPVWRRVTPGARNVCAERQNSYPKFMTARHESPHAPWNSSDVGRNRKEKPTIIEVDVNEIEEIIAATESGPLAPEQREKLLNTVRLLFEQIRSGKSSRKDSEKLERVLNALAKGKDAAGVAPVDKDKKPGHGRNGAAKFAGAKTVEVKHPELNKGDKCPACPPEKSGKIYPTKKPNVVIRLVGMAPIQATVYKMEVLRCNLCGQTFTAPAPEGIGEKKYDETVVSMLAVLKYGSGMPRNRLAGLQGRLGIPLPQPTQWELLKKGADELKALLKELLRQAAQGDVLHNDDTSMKILKIERPEEDTRTGIFTSTVVSTSAGDKPQIALFFTGWQHAGENLRDVLKLRRDELETPTRMGDAASKNRPKDDAGMPMDTDQANCLAHGRCYIVDAYEKFPEECRHILEELSIVFLADKKAKEGKMVPQQRLEYHQAHSGPVMERLKIWMDLLLAEKKVEPNSELGVAIRHLDKNWEPLTLFLRKPGVPLTNNLAERAMKKAVLNRKNAQFYRNQIGADVGDLLMSFIHTCELNKVDPFHYLTQVLRNTAKINADNAAHWMPWTYRDNAAAVSSPK